MTWTLRPFRVTVCWGSSSSHKVVGPFGGVELLLRAPTISGGAPGLSPFWPPAPVSGGSPKSSALYLASFLQVRPCRACLRGAATGWTPLSAEYEVFLRV